MGKFNFRFNRVKLTFLSEVFCSITKERDRKRVTHNTEVRGKLSFIRIFKLLQICLVDFQILEKVTESLHVTH